MDGRTVAAAVINASAGEFAADHLNGGYHPRGVVIRKRWIHRQAQHLVGQLLGQREGSARPLTRRQTAGAVASDSAPRCRCRPAASAACQRGRAARDARRTGARPVRQVGHGRQDRDRARRAGPQDSRRRPGAARVPAVQHAQLGAQEGGLHLVEARVHARAPRGGTSPSSRSCAARAAARPGSASSVVTAPPSPKAPRFLPG